MHMQAKSQPYSHHAVGMSRAVTSQAMRLHLESLLKPHSEHHHVYNLYALHWTVTTKAPSQVCGESKPCIVLK